MVNIEIVGYFADVLKDKIKESLQGLNDYHLSTFAHDHSYPEGFGSDATYLRIVYEKKNIQTVVEITKRLEKEEMTAKIRIEYHRIPLSLNKPDSSALRKAIDSGLM
jgi:hypothetical protein